MRGIYLLEIRVERHRALRVGALGRIDFAPGTYVYVGSAQTGLEPRVARHFRTRKRTHWHIDYLLSAAGVALSRAFYAEADRRYECEAARALQAVARPVRGFGSSDCTCAGHLFRMPDGACLNPRLAGLVWRPVHSQVDAEGCARPEKEGGPPSLPERPGGPYSVRHTAIVTVAVTFLATTSAANRATARPRPDPALGKLPTGHSLRQEELRSPNAVRGGRQSDGPRADPTVTHRRDE